MTETGLEITLTRAEALVLFELLARYKDSRNLDVTDSSEETVLWKILGILESKLPEPFAGNYLEILETARCSLRIDVDNDS